MKINIFGSTGTIGQKSLKLINDYFPHIKVNLLCANTNYKLLNTQIKKFNPKFVYLKDKKNLNLIKSKIDHKTKILNYNELIDYLNNSKSNLSILAISGYKSLYFLDHIINNTENLGLVSKEAIVSAGHLFKKKKYFKNTNIFPLDSEHFSLFNFFNNSFSHNNINKIILTASGGPFYKKKFSNLNNISFNEAINHPKWKMGYKNSIDSATLVNKCLEVVEAHYLFNIPYEKIDVLIHPEAIIHSIVQYKNYVSNMNLFKNDMNIPIMNFLSKSKINNRIHSNKLMISDFSSYNFFKVKYDYFPIYKYFLNMDKSQPSNLIKFNIGNEFAVNMFKDKYIKYTDIYRIIKKVCSLNLYSSLKNIKDIIEYHEKIEDEISKIYKNYY